MYRKALITLAVLTLVLTAVAPAAFAEETTEAIGIHAILDHYEQIRTALVADTVEGTAEHAKAIEDGLATLHHHFDAGAAAVEAQSKVKALDLLGKMHLAATTMAKATQAGNLDATRNAFYELSKPLVQYRELMTGEKPVVAYCPMEKKSWLQDDGAIGNPYAGQSMPTCGSVVADGR